MARVGSARSDENHRLVNGIAGDQRQTSMPDMTGEVSMEPWYLHTKGWIVIRIKDPAKREKAAYAMEAACNNKNIGYSQSNRWTAQDWCKWQNKENYDPATITKPVNVDCSALVRLCCKYAGIETGDIYTSIMPQTMAKMPDFEVITDKNITDNPANQYRGDILCTRSSGHTVIVLDDGDNVKKLSKYKYVYNGKAYDDEFDPEFYANKYADLKAAFGNDAAALLKHWVEYGKAEGRIAKEVRYILNGVDYTDEFDPIYYANKYADLKAAFGTDAKKLLVHWVQYGKNEGRIAKASKEPPKEEPKPTPPEIPEVEENAIATAKTTVAVRTSSSTKGKILGYIQKGQEVKVLQQLSNGWLKIEWEKDDKTYGYTSNKNGNYYTISKASAFPYDVQVTANALFIRKGPGTEYPTVDVIHAGEKYTITKIENEKWGKLQDNRGYISMNYVQKV